MDSIKLNDILRLDNLTNVKIRFNLMFAQNWNPIELFKNGDISTMLAGQYWNYNKNKSYKEGQITVGLVKIKPKEDLWLLFHIGQVTKDLNNNFLPHEPPICTISLRFNNANFKISASPHITLFCISYFETKAYNVL